MKIFVGCSSRDNIPEKYKEDCYLYLTKLLREYDLVFGADDTGLMGLSYNIATKNNKQIIGICPELYKNDFKKINCSTEITTKNVTERINNIIEISDALIYLPGGFGTFAELFVAIDCKRCHEFDKPIIIYNSENYYDKILIALRQVYEEEFAILDLETIYHISSSAEDTLQYIDEYYRNDKTDIKQKIYCNK